MDILGHRGARALFPENTLQGFLAASALGVTAFELDVGMTRDGVVVVHHDMTLNPDIARDEAGAWLEGEGPAVWSLTYNELQRYDVGRLRPGSPTATLFPGQTPSNGARIPTLAAVLEALPSTRFTIEVKTRPDRPSLTAPPERLTEATLAAIDTARAGGRIVLESFDWRVQRHARKLRPELRLAWLTPAAGQEPPLLPAAVATEGGPVWAPDYRTLTEAAVAEAHALSLSVLPWTVNQPEDMRRLADWGVDGLISDWPDLALRLFG